MLSPIWPWAVAAAALAPSVTLADDSRGQSTFVSPGGDVAFGFAVPDHDNSNVLFSLRVPAANSWGAVGLGSDDMKGALFLIVYRNTRGDNVTFSPRIAYGNYEPQHFADVKYEVLSGTGIVDDHMVLVAKCSEHCRSWPAADSSSGYIDVSSPNQQAIYAVGPREDFASDSPSAALKFHREYGVFSIDMKRTQGAPGLPLLTDNSTSVGTSLQYRRTGRLDYKATLHAALMVFFFVVMLPLGVLALKLGRWASWHGLTQSVAMVGALVGLALGVVASFNYQRSRGFRSPHQILGFIVIGFILGQFTIGLLHRHQHRKTQAPTLYGRVHRWSGRVIIVLGTLNALLGFSFALNRTYGLVLAGCLIFGCFVVLLLTIGRQRFFRKTRFQPVGGPLGDAPTGYQPQPWRDDHETSGSGYPHHPPPGYEPASQQIGLEPISPSPSTPWKSSDAKELEDEAALGSVQRPRDFA